MADPPWLERGGGTIKRGADRHYRLMKTRDICALPVRDWMAADSHLYLWVTNNFLPDGLTVMAAWGYRYVTCVTWMKDRAGLGQYFRGMTEHCLFGVRGGIPYRLSDDGGRLQGMTGFFEAPRGEHSAKPDTMRRMISHRTKAALRAKRARGQRAGNLPFGYSLNADGRTLDSNPDEQEVLSVLRELRTAGYSLRAIAAELNRQGFTTRRGTAWRHQYVASLAA